MPLKFVEIAFALALTTGASAQAPTTPHAPPNPPPKAPANASPDPASPRRDLGGRTYRGETTGFKVTLAFGDDDVRVFLTTPGLITVAMDVCLAELAIGVASELVCDHGRKISLQPTPRGYLVTLGGTLVTEARAYLGPRQYGPQGPVVYDAVAVSPVEVAFLSPEFHQTRDRVGNSSPETQVLESFLPRQRIPSPAETRRRIEDVLDSEGIDPLTVPLPVVERLMVAVAEGGTTARLIRILDEAARRAATSPTSPTSSTSPP